MTAADMWAIRKRLWNPYKLFSKNNTDVLDIFIHVAISTGKYIMNQSTRLTSFNHYSIHLYHSLCRDVGTRGYRIHTHWIKWIEHIAHDYKLVRLCLMFSKQILQGTLYKYPSEMLFSATQDFAQAVAT